MRILCHGSWLLLLLVVSTSVACGDDETQPAGGAGGRGGAPGGAGEGGEPEMGAPDIEAIRAPDETSIVVDLQGNVAQAPAQNNAYEVTSLVGDLVVTSVTFDAAAQTITLGTAQQKLGIEYTLRVKAPGDPLDLKGGPFLSADTAMLGASDFSDPNFADYEVVATRLAVGESSVIYATADGVGDDAEETIAYFDNEIFPIETALFNEAPDRDENGKTVILGLDGGGYYGGYFSPVNTLTEEQAQQGGYHSNEMEMLYISPPDLQGSFDPVGVVAHEYSHLLYNEAHDFFSEDWQWHNEGLAECAVHAVAGVNEIAVYWYGAAPNLGDGQSLVRWVYSNYDQYVQAYVFWTYAASRLGGVDGYGELFDLTGNPADVGDFFQAQLGSTFPELHLDMLTATWLQNPTGIHGFDGMLDLDAAQTASGAPQDLESFEGVLFPGLSSSVAPIGAGANVVHRGVNSSGAVDDSAPFDAQGGVIIALNTNQDADDSAEESSGTFPSAATATGGAPRAGTKVRGDSFLWLHPPPLKPANRRALLAWRRAAHGF